MKSFGCPAIDGMPGVTELPSGCSHWSVGRFPGFDHVRAFANRFAWGELLAGGFQGSDIQGNGVEVEFFDERTTLPGGPATLALRTGAPLLPAAVYFTRTGHRYRRQAVWQLLRRLSADTPLHPHALRHFYVTTAHGFPFGSIWKYSRTPLRISGRRVGPPTRITPSRSRATMPACWSASSQTLKVRISRSCTRLANSRDVSVYSSESVSPGGPCTPLASAGPWKPRRQGGS